MKLAQLLASGRPFLSSLRRNSLSTTVSSLNSESIFLISDQPAIADHVRLQGFLAAHSAGPCPRDGRPGGGRVSPAARPLGLSRFGMGAGHGSRLLLAEQLPDPSTLPNVREAARSRAKPSVVSLSSLWAAGVREAGQRSLRRRLSRTLPGAWEQPRSFGRPRVSKGCRGEIYFQDTWGASFMLVILWAQQGGTRWMGNPGHHPGGGRVVGGNSALSLPKSL